MKMIWWWYEFQDDDFGYRQNIAENDDDTNNDDNSDDEDAFVSRLLEVEEIGDDGIVVVVQNSSWVSLNSFFWPAGMQQMSVNGWTEEVRLTGLASDQKYLIVAESWTAAGRSVQNSTKVLATKSADTIAVGFIVLIAFACAICVVLVSIGLCSIIRFVSKLLLSNVI